MKFQVTIEGYFKCQKITRQETEPGKFTDNSNPYIIFIYHNLLALVLPMNTTELLHLPLVTSERAAAFCTRHFSSLVNNPSNPSWRRGGSDETAPDMVANFPAESDVTICPLRFLLIFAEVNFFA